MEWLENLKGKKKNMTKAKWVAVVVALVAALYFLGGNLVFTK